MLRRGCGRQRRGFPSLERPGRWRRRALRAPAPEQPLGALCPRGRGARPSLVLPRPRNLAGTGTGAAGRRLEVGVEQEAGWVGWLGRRLCRSSRLTKGQGEASRGSEPSSSCLRPDRCFLLSDTALGYHPAEDTSSLLLPSASSPCRPLSFWHLHSPSG